MSLIAKINLAQTVNDLFSRVTTVKTSAFKRRMRGIGDLLMLVKKCMCMLYSI